MLHSVGKQAYKVELLRSLKIHDIFYVSLLEQDTIRKGWVDKVVRQMELNIGDNDDGE